MIRVGESGHRASLVRRDLIVFEQRLLDTVTRLFPFTSHSIHFPRSLENNTAEWIAKEGKLLLPLASAEGEVLGVFVARGVLPKTATAISAHWPTVGSLVTENLLLYKRSLCDPVTGLFTRHYLLHGMEREIDIQRDHPATASPQAAQETAATRADGSSGKNEGIAVGEIDTRRGSFATLVIRLAALRDVVREFGYQFADELMVALADALTSVCPEQALVARTGDSEFAVHLPAAGHKACRNLAREIVQALRKVYIVHPLRKERVSTCASVGYTLYPQDMTGSVFIRTPAEQARLVLRKARLASALADENLPSSSGRGETEPVMGFGRILAEGGRVIEALPLSRVVVSLGASMHAREGQRFSVWASPEPGNPHTNLAPMYKGEIALMEVHETVSQAEVIHLGEPGWAIAPGDHLVLLPEEQGSLAQSNPGEARTDPATGLLRHGDFLARWADERERVDAFALALIRLAPKPEEYTPETASQEGSEEEPEVSRPSHFMSEAVRLCREEIGKDAGFFGGRYGLNSLIFYHPGPDVAALHKRYETLASALEERLNLTVAVGIAAHPYLDFRKADALDNCRKTLEYAMLLPRPHVGLLDTLALNISADKRFSQGDTFGAIKEYQLALLADETNSMAWNSLGICLAGLGRHAEAERNFSRALDVMPDDAMAWYNLGYMHQSQNRPAEARECYQKCLAHDGEHLYATIRVGQLAENAGDKEEARHWYQKAATLPGGKGMTYRHFARLSVADGKPDEAREHLHEALLHDPQDALAMSLLSRLYLDAGEDPDMAASFARQSVSLRPELRAGWLQLARAMDALGQDKEARAARLKAEEV